MNRVLGMLLVAGFFLGMAFFLSGMEAGVFALNRLRIRQQMRAGSKQARVLHSYLEHPEDFLWTILIGNSVAIFAALGLMLGWLGQWMQSRPVWLIPTVLALAFLLYTFCDLLPKMLFRLYPNRLCIRLVWLFRLVHLVLAPLVRPVAWLARHLLPWSGGRTFTGHLFASREELRMLIEETSQGVSSEERAMINRVLDLQNVVVSQLTLPLSKTFSVRVETPMAEALALCREQNLTRLPVWTGRERGEKVAGIVSLKSLLYRPDLDPSRPAGDYLRPALFLESDLRVEVALRRMQKSGQRLAIVIDRDRREIGVLSLHDVLEFIFGEIRL